MFSSKKKSNLPLLDAVFVSLGYAISLLFVHIVQTIIEQHADIISAGMKKSDTATSVMYICHWCSVKSIQHCGRPLISASSLMKIAGMENIALRPQADAISILARIPEKIIIIKKMAQHHLCSFKLQACVVCVWQHSQGHNKLYCSHLYVTCCRIAFTFFET